MEGVEDGQTEAGPVSRPTSVSSGPIPTPPAPRRPLNLATAIERQMAGHFGLTDEQFATLFAKG